MSPRLHVFFALVLAAALAPAARAQVDPVAWSIAEAPVAAAPGGTAVARIAVDIEPGWHLYATTTPQGVPNALAVYVADSPAVASWEGYQPRPKTQFDPNFQIDSEWYVESAEFTLAFAVPADAPAGEHPVKIALRYGVCDDKMCLPPALRTVETTILVDPGVRAMAFTPPDGAVPMAVNEIPARLLERNGLVEATEAAPAPASETTTGAPASEPAPTDRGFVQFAAVAFGFGLLAIFTPCVFPMIPITMSYFVSTQSGETKASLVQATTFAVGVIALFTGLGAAVSAILGPFGMSQLGSNVWVNLFIAVVFFAFGASLLGAFEITVPSGAMTKLNAMTGGGGLLATLMMGLVFALASFACTGPFVGALLAGSVGSGSLAWPIFGMLMFSAGLALPFFGLALFPSMLKKMPRAGGWMTRVKIGMSFLIFAAAFKYLSNVDMMYQWELLTRERFLAIWVVLLALDGAYLLGFLKLEDDGGEQRVGLPSFAVGTALLMLAVSLIPGMFGGHLGEIEAYVPSTEYSGLQAAGFGGGGGAAAGKAHWLKDDYEGALAAARESGTPVLVSFTGYSCTNCKWMKANMFTRPAIAEAIAATTPVELYTDSLDYDKAERFQQMQIERFGTAAIPFYALIEPDETVIATFPGRTRDEQAFADFLQTRSRKEVSSAR